MSNTSLPKCTGYLLGDIDKLPWIKNWGGGYEGKIKSVPKPDFFSSDQLKLSPIGFIFQ